MPQADGTDFDAGDFTSTPGSNDETVTIYEFMTDSTGSYAVPSYSFEWPTITDPEGVERKVLRTRGPGDIYGASSIDDAMKNCYTQTRKFLMAKYGLTDAEAATFITVGVDFATTQLVDGRVLLYAIDATPARWRGDVGSSPLDGTSAATSSPRKDLVKNYRVHPTHWLISTQVDGNWGVHAEIPKAMFEAAA